MMKKIIAIAALAGIGLTVSLAYANMSWTSAVADGKIYAQEDCAEGETWNEETAKCEPKTQ